MCCHQTGRITALELLVLPLAGTPDKSVIRLDGDGEHFKIDQTFFNPACAGCDREDQLLQTVIYLRIETLNPIADVCAINTASDQAQAIGALDSDRHDGFIGAQVIDKRVREIVDLVALDPLRTAINWYTIWFAIEPLPPVVTQGVACTTGLPAWVLCFPRVESLG